MARDGALALLAVVLALPAAADAAWATSAFLDPGSRDPDAACHGAAAMDPEILYREREAAVFTVMVTREGKLEPNGTATLVDDQNGIFLTAAHVVHFYRDMPIVVARKVRGEPRMREFPVRIFPGRAATDNWRKEDVALLQAESWRPHEMPAVPVRLDAVNEFIKGFFVGHAEGMDRTVIGDFTVAFGEAGAGSNIVYRGSVFPHASGALLLDGRGRAFGVVVRDADLANLPLADVSSDQLRRILWERQTFSAFPLRVGLDRIKSIPPGAAAAELIRMVTEKGVSNEFLYGLQHRVLTPIDMIHLTDTVFSPAIWQKVPPSGVAQLVLATYPVAAATCTHKYWADTFAQNYAGPPADPAAVGPAPQRAGRSSPPVASAHDLGDMLRRIETRPLAGAEDLAIFRDLTSLCVERAIAAAGRNEPALALVHARVGLAFARRVAGEASIRQALAAGVKNRDQAALLANLAVAEDMAGNREEARAAILAADALGGSAAAYHLAARLAFREHAPAAAAGLFARAHAMLTDAVPDEAALRAGIEVDFRVLATLAPGLAGARIDRFDIAFMAADRPSRWYALAAGEARPPTFRTALLEPQDGRTGLARTAAGIRTPAAAVPATEARDARPHVAKAHVAKARVAKPRVAALASPAQLRSRPAARDAAQRRLRAARVHIPPRAASRMRRVEHRSCWHGTAQVNVHSGGRSLVVTVARAPGRSAGRCRMARR